MRVAYGGACVLECPLMRAEQLAAARRRVLVPLARRGADLRGRWGRRRSAKRRARSSAGAELA